MKILSYLKRKAVLLFQLKQFVKLESNKNQSMGWMKFVKSARNGFYSISPLIYDFENNNKEGYLSDWRRLTKASKINGPRRVVFDDKLVFHHLNKNNPHVLSIVALTMNGKLFEKTDTGLRELQSLMPPFFIINDLIIKPYSGGGGNQISKVTVENGKLVFSCFCSTEQQFEEKIVRGSRDFLMTEIIKQDNYASALYPQTLNTIRILTMMDSKTNKPFIVTAVQRVGTKKSKVVDNWTVGGISIKIDIETGVMGRGATYTQGKDGKLEWHIEHPDTKVRFCGERIPNWNNMVDYVLKLSQEYHYLPYIGWDIVPLENDFLVLEGNTNSDVNLLQIHGGLLKDEKVRRFYKEHKVI